jgi:hypothetical protein
LPDNVCSIQKHVKPFQTDVSKQAPADAPPVLPRREGWVIFGAMEWTIHATVPYPMLQSPETARLLAGNGVGPEI